MSETGGNADRTFAQFAKAVESSVTEFAERKGYNGPLPDAAVHLETLGIARQHGLGEIYYKWREFQKTPKRVILEKIAGWCFVLWRETR